MSIAPFAAMEQRGNAVVFARLANAEVSIAGGPVFGGVFDDAYTVGGVGVLGMASSQPQVVVPAAMVPAAPVGAAISVRGVVYVIAAAEPDGVGGTRLLLERDLEAVQP